MVMGQLEALLQELAQALEINELAPDANNTCLLKLKNGIDIQIELEKGGNNLLILSELGNVPPGRFREDLFREALKANGKNFPRYGNFAYSKQKDVFIIFDLLPIKDLNGEMISHYITPFSSKAQTWKEAIESGNIPVISEDLPTGGNIGLFGLRP